MRAEVTRAELAVWGPAAAEQTTGEDAVCRDRDPELATCRKELRLDPARDQRVLDLEVADRPDRGGATDRLRADLGQSNRAHVARVDEFADRADGLLDRDGGIEARRAVHIDVIGP